MSELPKVNTTENLLNVLSSTQGEGVAAMICTANWGPLDEAKLISSLYEYKKQYGTDGTNITGHNAAETFFNNGGYLRIIRIEDGTASKATHTFKDGSAVDAIVVSGAYKGTYGNNINITIVENGSARDIYISDGVTNEAYYSLSSNAAIISAINSGDLCEATLVAGTPDLVTAITATYLTSGDDGADSLTDSMFTTAFDSYLNTVDYRYLVIPGKTDNSFQTTIVGKLNTRATNEEKYSRYLTGVTKDEEIATIKARTLNGKRATLCTPSLVLNDETLDGSYLACSLAGKLCSQSIGIAGTNKVLIAEVDIDYNKPEQAELLNDSVTVISNINDSIRCVKDMTRDGDLTSAFKLGVITDEVDYARTQYEEFLKNRIGTPNTASNRASIANGLDIISSAMIDDSIIEEANTASVVIGASADTITATISILPIYSIDFINLTINVR